ncbi:MAG: transposase [Thermoanaerobaculia bacterium]
MTCRTVQGRLLLQPTGRVADLCRGVLARAARLYPVRIHAFAFLGNHYHLLLTAASAQRLAAFMNYLNSNLAREIGRVVDWREKFWGRRYQAILVSGEEAAQVERLVYLLRHGSKENLVRSPADWPGANAVESLRTGAPVVGGWIDRTGLSRASRRGERLDSGDFSSRERLELMPLPCWSHLRCEAYRERISDLVRAIERDFDRRREDTGRAPVGRARLELQDPHSAPPRVRRSPAPLVHAASRAVRESLKDAYRLFAGAFRRASVALRLQPRVVAAFDLFPAGSFPPPGPFIAGAIASRT